MPGRKVNSSRVIDIYYPPFMLNYLFLTSSNIYTMQIPEIVINTLKKIYILITFILLWIELKGG
jgi:hypothetical protein